MAGIALSRPLSGWPKRVEMYYDRPITKERVMILGDFAGLVADEPHPGVHRRTFDSEGATVTQYSFEPSARFPLHQHPQEQITIVQRGALEFTIGDELHELTAGGWSVVPGNVPHSIQAGADGAEIVAIIVPRRESADAYSLVGDGDRA
jgi:quercetin dioxygenase-like cupin family protein